MDAKRFIPTDMGRIVNGFLTEHFTQYVDYDFTARLEDDLDAVSLGEKDWVPLLEEFWQPFRDLCVEKESSVTREQVAQARELGTDPKSGKPVTVRMGRYGPFVQIGTKDDEEKPKFAGLRPGQKMNDIDLDAALELFKLPRKLGKTPDGLSVSASFRGNLNSSSAASRSMSFIFWPGLRPANFGFSSSSLVPICTNGP